MKRLLFSGGRKIQCAAREGRRRHHGRLAPLTAEGEGRDATMGIDYQVYNKAADHEAPQHSDIYRNTPLSFERWSRATWNPGFGGDGNQYIHYVPNEPQRLHRSQVSEHRQNPGLKV
ncbi:hypothetical protein NM208_g9436 [Fusarium decemcellulare]|uniref:Uncharacterized protein n=1 Tax=Fusarium decemcellulare TaxID=57161 RepID=A0ACC1S1K4_9HYPO|nr:hypothetical protein NM208_g9436 [Fusarium decemcellulare]